MNSHIGYLIKSINDKVKIHADADLKTHNLTLAQSRVLIYLMKHGQQATQKEIEDSFEVSHPTIVGLVTRMEKNGFLTCRMDTYDRRNKIVGLTELGVSTARNMGNVIGKMEKKMLVPLTDDDIIKLTDMLETILKNLQ